MKDVTSLGRNARTNKVFRISMIRRRVQELQLSTPDPSNLAVNWFFLGVVFSLGIVAAALGIYARFVNLEASAYAVDEYYSARAAQYILESGLPEFTSGGFYTRSPIYHYLTAASFSGLGSNEFALRLPAAVFGTVAAFLTYLYARAYLPWPLAVAVVVALLVSSWHVEFSRFGRMYTLFQCTTLVMLISLHAVCVLGRWECRYALHGTAILAVLSHELGILLSPLVFLPLLSPEIHKRQPPIASYIRFVFVGIITCAIVFAVFKLGEFRDAGISDVFPDDFEAPESSGFLVVGAFPFWKIADQPVVNLFFALGLAAGIAGALGVLLHRRGFALDDALLVMALILVAAHQFIPAAALSVIAVVRSRMWAPGLCPRRRYVLLALVGCASFAWLAYAMYDRRWMEAVATRDIVAGLRQTFMGWPDIYGSVVYPWRQELPTVGALVLVAVIYLTVRQLRRRWAEFVFSPNSIILYVGLCFSLLEQDYFRTRYYFSIYPVMLCAIALATKELSGSVVRATPGGGKATDNRLAAVVFLSLFVLSGDFSMRHLIDVHSPTALYRTGPFSSHRLTWYPRRDVRSPSQFANRERTEGARIVAVDLIEAAAYLDDPYAIYYGRDSLRFLSESRNRGHINLWTGGPLLSTYEDVREYTHHSSEVLVMRDVSLAAKDQTPFHLQDIWGDRIIGMSRGVQSDDQRIEIVRLRLRPE